MPEPRNQEFETIKPLLEKIHNLHDEIEEISQPFRSVVTKAEERMPPKVSRKSGDFCTMVAYRDSLVKVSPLLKEKFNYIE
ncbi:MAG: hypothetical protein HY912_19975 [Desulfomonile tiedjei]|uniref:Uncharacterized protein n=1 Tax=Desulfomonile tiedjei TaxID=2358 RepID=A0A9D6V5A8_9BACT|nr:hypothetical protein [Desulfomonile tiedjei]